MDIRFAQPEDLESIAGLYVRNHKAAYRGLLSDAYLDALNDRWALEKWERELQDADTVLWAAFEGDSILGFAAGLPDAELEQTWYLESLHVAEGARGKGVGTALIRTAARYAQERGFRRMSVCIVRGNDRAGELYRRLGAGHYSFFEDDFRETVSESEKLVWEQLPAPAL